MNSSLSNNLSELDMLLEELGSSQFNVSSAKRTSEVSSNDFSNKNGDSNENINISHRSTTSELDNLLSSLSNLSHNENNLEASYCSEETSQPNEFCKQTVDQSQNIYDNTSIDHHDNLNRIMEDLNRNMADQGLKVVSQGHCAACDKPIIDKVITALGQTWHPEHFVCSFCRQEIGTENFFERDGQPYCEKDYFKLFSPKCAWCKGAILTKCVTALDQTWHPEHFVCFVCGRELADEPFRQKDGHVFCEKDFLDYFSQKCGTCGGAISKNFITALNQQFHPECFVCFECKKPFGKASFFEYEGFPYCEIHYYARKGSLCAKCEKPIVGRCITAMGKKFHPDHFICSFCQRSLTKGTFMEHEEKPYCHPCFGKLLN